MRQITSMLVVVGFAFESALAQTDSQPRGEDATIHFHVERHVSKPTSVPTPVVTPTATPTPEPTSSPAPFNPASTDSPTTKPIVHAFDSGGAEMIESESENAEVHSDAKPQPYMVPQPSPKPEKPPAIAEARQYQADVVTQSQGISVEAHIFVDGDNIRSDMTTMGMETSVVVNSKDKQFFQLMPQTNTLVRLPWSDDVQQLISPGSLSGATWTRVAQTETIGGVIGNVWTVLEPNGQGMKVDISPATGAPLKVISDDGSFAVLWKNYKPGPVDPSLFKKPRDYNEIETPEYLRNINPNQLGIRLW